MIRQIEDPPLAHVRETLLEIGYDPQAVVTNYDFAVPRNHNVLDKVDLVAFSDPFRHDLHTSCIAAHRIQPDSDVKDIIESLSYLATPFALILNSHSVEIWPVSRKPPLQPFESVEYNRLNQYFVDHDSDFRPSSLAAAKTKGYQLSFFDIDRTLLEFAYEATQDILVDRFECAVGVARETLRARDDLESTDLTKSALQILAAAILEDKQLIGGARSSSVADLMRRSSRRYRQYFDTEWLERIGHEAAQATLDTLRQGATFRSFTNEMLGYFYENAFVDDEIRKKLGIYYTPRAIAKRILSRLPIEELPPSERIVFDGSAGSGNLLLAAFERMADLLPSAWDRERRHSYLVRRIYGVDVDRFAALVAGLSLFFIDLPADDTWNVRAGDFLVPEPTVLPISPTIIVGNPPFREERSSGGQRLQRASLFLTRYLDLLKQGGLLGVVLPETFLENSSCRSARRRLLDECEILELWHLPEGMFPMSNAATAVVIARKRSVKHTRSSSAVRVERVGARAYEQRLFLSHDRLRFSYVLPSTKSWVRTPDCRVASSPLDSSVWNKLESSRSLGDVSEIRNGIIPGKSRRSTHFDRDRRGDDWRPWIGKTTDFEPYAIKPSESIYIKYPGELQWPRLDLESVFASPNRKVLVNSGRAPGNPWRIFAAVDDVGLFPSQGIHCVIPTDSSISLEEFVAVLNSSVASAWVDSHNRKRWIGEDTMRAMPFPLFPYTERNLVISRVRELVTLKKRALISQSPVHSEVASIRELVMSIDDLVCDALAIGSEGREMLKRVFDRYQRPGLEWGRPRQPSDEELADVSGRKWSITGQVLRTNIARNIVFMWIRGFNDDRPFRMSIPETMPGWALRPDAAFEAEVAWEVRDVSELRATDLLRFRPLDFSYSETEQLLELMKNPRTLDEIYGV